MHMQQYNKLKKISVAIEKMKLVFSLFSSTMSTINRVRKQLIWIQKDGPVLGIYATCDGEDLFKQFIMIQNRDGLLFFFELDMPADFPFNPPKIKHITPYIVPKHPRMPLGGRVYHEVLNTYGEGWEPALAVFHVLLDVQLLTNELVASISDLDNLYRGVFEPVLSGAEVPPVVAVFKDEIKKIWNELPEG